MMYIIEVRNQKFNDVYNIGKKLTVDVYNIGKKLV